MSEVLSQNEIDSLLTAISSGEMDAEDLKESEGEKKIKEYDFKRALRFSKDQMRSLSRIFENFSRLLTTYFSAQLRTFVQISVASVDQLPYEEFIRSIPKMTILNVYRTSPLEGRMVMEINPNIAYAMLDRVLGGKGDNSGDVANLTEIETLVMERIFKQALSLLPEAFKSIISITPEMEMLEVNPQFMQIVSPNETVAVVSISTKIGEVSGMINFCLPHMVLEPLIPKLSAHHWLASHKKERQPIEIQTLENRVKKTMLPLIADLGYSSISVNEFLQLTEGNVIRLHESVGDPLVIKAGTKPKFLAQPGIFKRKNAIQITEVLREEEEEHDR